jgi:hypothetical protein
VISTPGSLITFTMKAMGILGVGQSALAEDYTDVFDSLNAMLATWNRKRYLIWHLVDVATLSTGAQFYTVGAVDPSGVFFNDGGVVTILPASSMLPTSPFGLLPGSYWNNGGVLCITSGTGPGNTYDFTIPRPDRLESAFFRQFVNSSPNQVDFPLRIIQSREDYNRIALKQLTSSLPTHIFYDSSQPIGVVYPIPIPPAGVGEIHITVKDTLTAFATYTQVIDLPPEYFRALWSNLALDASALYPGSNVTDQTRAIAKDSLATIRGANTQIARLQMPRSLRRRNAGYNVLSDQGY